MSSCYNNPPDKSVYCYSAMHPPNLHPHQLAPLTRNNHPIFKLLSMHAHSHLLLFFYRKATLHHSRKNTLIRKLQSLLKKCEMDNEDHSHLLKMQHDPTSDRPTPPETSILRRAASGWGLESLFLSHSFDKAVLFAVINRVIQAEDFLTFKCLE